MIEWDLCLVYFDLMMMMMFWRYKYVLRQILMRLKLNYDCSFFISNFPIIFELFHFVNYLENKTLNKTWKPTKKMPALKPMAKRNCPRRSVSRLVLNPRWLLDPIFVIRTLYRTNVNLCSYSCLARSWVDRGWRFKGTLWCHAIDHLERKGRPPTLECFGLERRSRRHKGLDQRPLVCLEKVVK